MPSFYKMGVQGPSSPKQGRSRRRDASVRNHMIWASDVASFSPDDLDSLALWLKADAGITKDGSNRVSAWASQVGSYSVTQGTGSKQPLYVASQINSLPIIRFLTNDFMQKTSSVFNGDASLPMTVAVVLKIAAAAAAGTDTQHAFGIGGAETQGENALVWTGKADDALATFKLSSTKLDPTSVSDGDIAVATTKLLMYEIHANGECNLWVDRDLVKTSTVATDGTLSSIARVGGWGTKAPDMDLAEMCVWQGIIPGAQKQNFFTYINDRWGIL